MTMQTAEEVRAIIARQAMVDPSEIGPETTLAELGIDSIGLVEVIYAVEESFAVQVPFNSNEADHAGFDITSVGSITRAVEALITARDGQVRP
jgi:acyl carrier protein